MINHTYLIMGKKFHSYYEFWEEQFKLGDKGVLLELCHNYLLRRLQKFADVTVLDLSKDAHENLGACKLLRLTPDKLNLMLSKKQNAAATSINLRFRKIAISLNSFMGLSRSDFVVRTYKIVSRILNRIGSPIEVKVDNQWEERLLRKVSELEQKLGALDA